MTDEHGHHALHDDADDTRAGHFGSLHIALVFQADELVAHRARQIRPTDQREDTLQRVVFFEAKVFMERYNAAIIELARNLQSRMHSIFTLDLIVIDCWQLHIDMYMEFLVGCCNLVQITIRPSCLQ